MMKYRDLAKLSIVMIALSSCAIMIILGVTTYRALSNDGEPAPPEMQALQEATAIVEWPDGFIGTNSTFDYAAVYVDMPRIGTIITISAGGAITVYDPTTGNLSIRINPDGSSEIGPDYKPDVAARQFWKAVARYMPQKGEK
ncbi:MAG: hypothetical protein ABIH23_19750, partial [bacterium]